MPLPVIGSVLLDGGQGLRTRPGRRKVSPMLKKIFQRCNKMPLHGPGRGLSDPQFAAQNHIRPCQRNALRGDASQRDAPYHSPQTLGIRQSRGGNSHSEFASAPHCVFQIGSQTPSRGSSTVFPTNRSETPLDFKRQSCAGGTPLRLLLRRSRGLHTVRSPSPIQKTSSRRDAAAYRGYCRARTWRTHPNNSPADFLIPFSQIKVMNQPDRQGWAAICSRSLTVACYGVTMLNQKYWFRSAR